VVVVAIWRALGSQTGQRQVASFAAVDQDPPRKVPSFAGLNQLAPAWASRAQMFGGIGLTILGIAFVVVGTASGTSVVLWIGVVGLVLGLLNLA
jgi:hypothetical protein